MSKFDIWLIVGLGGQVLFTLRFFVQWLASEKQKKSVVPVSFWYFSIGGSFFLLAYAIHREDPVFILGQSMGFVIYFRNLVLIGRDKRNSLAAQETMKPDE
ncbi:MAG: lipid-A-disaccharide synthase N-terminal domain-containing protein [Candidatus Riflebacteria bacterium]|nr:lipid-A-disaccharide synthase N-terminal domain-containing protein [Candidatus Riflebacteria bacterium]